MSYSKMLLFAAVIPAAILMIYVFKKDKADKEPLWLLALLFVAGAIVTTPAAYFEGLIDEPLTNFFAGVQRNCSSDFGIDAIYYIYNFVDAMVVPGLVEEAVKLVALYVITSKSKNFNSYFDGIIYAIFVSLGFATLENILYVFGAAYSYEIVDGFATAIVRSYTSIPGHMFFAVFMGFYYTEWHQRKVLKGVSKDFSKCLIVPMIFHGLYDFFAFTMDDSRLLFIAFYVLLIFLYVICFGIIKSASKRDKMYRDMI